MEGVNVLFIVIAFVLGVGLCAVANAVVLKRKQKRILAEAEEKGEILKKEKLLQAKEKFLQMKSEYDKNVAERNSNLSRNENRVKQKETELNRKMEEIQRKLGKDARIGLLATSGTIQTGIYAEKAKAMGMPIFTPDEKHQVRVMAAIYGPQGAKAGYTDGVCREDLVSAAEYLVKTYDCNCLILGCTELPLILDEDDHFPVAGKTVCVVDPTAVLARKVVEVALETNRQRGIC